MKSALIYFTSFFPNIGGSEFLVFSLVAELQARGVRVDLALSGKGVDPRAVSKDYDVKIEADQLGIIELLPRNKFEAWIDRHLHYVWRRKLRKLGHKYDYCFSCANPVDFGRPGVHFVNMMTLDRAFFEEVWLKGAPFIVHVKGYLLRFQDLISRCLAGVRCVRRILRDNREHVLPNSNYAKSEIERFYGCSVDDVFFPPTLFKMDRVESDKSNLDVACLGRLNPEKKIEDIVKIVELARASSGLPIRLRLAGCMMKGPYLDHLQDMAQTREWIQFEGMLTGEAKAKYLSECLLAIHACEVEAFGISITEYMKSGLPVMVPEKGAASEVLNCASLVYRDIQDGARILLRLINDMSFRKECVEHCIQRARDFSEEAYLAREKALVSRFIGEVDD